MIEFLLFAAMGYGLLLCFKLGSLSRHSQKMADLWQEQADRSERLSSKVFAQGMANSYRSGMSHYATKGYWDSRFIDHIEERQIRMKMLLKDKKEVS